MQNTIMLSIFWGSMNFSILTTIFFCQVLQNIFFLIRQKCSKINGAQMILHVDKLALYFLCSFCWHFHKIVWWFHFKEISNCCVFPNHPVYSLWRFLPISQFIAPSPFIILAEICQSPRLLFLVYSLLFETREYTFSMKWIHICRIFNVLPS